MLPKLVGFAGSRGCGKTTAAEACVDKFGAARLAFADPLKGILRDVFGFSYDQLYGTSKEVVDPRYGFSPRWIMRRLGTEGIRAHLGHDVWVKHLERRVRESKAPLVVVDDVRFANEADLIRSLGGVVILIQRHGKPADPGHASEALDLQWDRVMHVDDQLSVSDFREWVCEIVTEEVLEVCVECGVPANREHLPVCPDAGSGTISKVFDETR